MTRKELILDFIKKIEKIGNQDLFLTTVDDKGTMNISLVGDENKLAECIFNGITGGSDEVLADKLCSVIVNIAYSIAKCDDSPYQNVMLGMMKDVLGVNDGKAKLVNINLKDLN